MIDASDILIKYKKHSLAGHTKDELRCSIVNCLTGRVLSAYFFGSVATNTFTDESDVDLIIIVNTKTKFVLRSREFLDLLDIVPNMDILVYTPEEFSKLTTNPSLGFWQSVSKSLEKII